MCLSSQFTELNAKPLCQQGISNDCDRSEHNHLTVFNGYYVAMSPMGPPFRKLYTLWQLTLTWIAATFVFLCIIPWLYWRIILNVEFRDFLQERKRGKGLSASSMKLFCFIVRCQNSWTSKIQYIWILEYPNSRLSEFRYVWNPEFPNIPHSKTFRFSKLSSDF